ncbi:MAG: VWA domain-containing protein [Acidobacteriota bacterium]
MFVAGPFSKRILCSFSILIFLILSAFQKPPIRVEVEAVNVLVTVTDKKGRFVTDLPQGRFRIYEQGAQQAITNFRHESNLPLMIGLIMDTSSSVRLKLDFEKQAATNFIYSVMRPSDQALLVEFDTGVSLRHDFTAHPSAIASEIDQLKAGGGTALLDALYLVSREKMALSDARKTMVIVSDGMDLHSKRSLEEALDMALDSGVIIYAIGTSRFGADHQKKGEDLLEELAEQTGGRAFFPYSADLLHQAFDQIDQELRSQYSLTYVPSNKTKDGKFREIEVGILHNKDDLKVRHRKGYFAPGETS